VRNQAGHSCDDFIDQGHEAGWHFQSPHPGPKSRDPIRNSEMWSDRLPFIVVPLSKSWNGVSVVSKILDLHKWSVAASLLFAAGHRPPITDH
jgi:hypothetical protein